MSNPTAKVSKVENYEHVLMCLICRSLFDDYDHQPKFLPCHHTFCKECLREFVRQMGDEIDCPSCRKSATIPAAGVSALQTNFYAKYIQSLVYGLGGASGQFGASQNEMKCGRHEFQEASHFCKECSINVCNGCASGDCADHTKQPIVAVAEEFQDKIEVTIFIIFHYSLSLKIFLTRPRFHITHDNTTSGDICQGQWAYRAQESWFGKQDEGILRRQGSSSVTHWCRFWKSLSSAEQEGYPTQK